MTEEIIIDGVDIAGCVSFDKNNGYNICCYDDTRDDKIPFANFCVENKNCYYKQLKHLEQENRELSFAIEKCLENAGIECGDEEQALRSLPMLGSAHYKVLVEKEELKQENKELKELIGKTRYNRLEMYESFKTECNNYRSALEEINILAKNYCNACDEFKAKTYKNKNDCLYCNYGFIKRKINEVLNENKQN